MGAAVSVEATLMNRVKLARSLAVATVLFAVAFYTVGGAIKPGYSHAASFISELNATGTPWARELGLFGFVPLGTLFAAFLLAAYRVAGVHGASRAGFLLLWSQPVAFFGAAIAPCDIGCPIGGSVLQQAHDLLGLSTYLLAAIGIFLLSFAPGLSARGAWYLRGVAIAWLALFCIMLVPDLAPVRGLLQRLADGLLGSVVLVVAWRMLGRSSGNSAASNKAFKPDFLRKSA
jgi:hypothetical protein